MALYIYVAPIIAGKYLFDATQALLDRAIQQGSAQDKHFEGLNRTLMPGEVDGGVEFNLQKLVDQYLSHVEKGEITASTRQANSSMPKGFLQIVGSVLTTASITNRIFQPTAINC